MTPHCPTAWRFQFPSSSPRKARGRQPGPQGRARAPRARFPGWRPLAGPSLPALTAGQPRTRCSRARFRPARFTTAWGDCARDCSRISASFHRARSRPESRRPRLPTTARGPMDRATINLLTLKGFTRARCNFLSNTARQPRTRCSRARFRRSRVFYAASVPCARSRRLAHTAGLVGPTLFRAERGSLFLPIPGCRARFRHMGFHPTRHCGH